VFGGYSFADPGYMLQKYHWMNERQHGSRKRLYALSSVRRSISSSAAWFGILTPLMAVRNIP